MVRRLSEGYSLALLPALLLLNLITAQRVLPTGPYPLTLFGVVALPLVVIGFALWGLLPGRRRLLPVSWPVAATFGVLLAWAALSGIGKVREARISELGTNSQVLPDWVAYVPLVEAAAALLSAWLLVAATRAGALRVRLFGVCALMLACGVIGEVRALTDQRIDSRLDTGLGGAATLPVVLILVTATLLGLAASGYRRRQSGALAGVATFELLLTGSRSGAIMLVLLLLLGAAGWWASGRRSLRDTGRGLAIAGGVVAVGAALTSFVPELRRIFHTTDPSREQNALTAWGIVTQDWHRVLFGMGTGVIWPWYASDAHVLPDQVPKPWTWVSVPYSDGFLLQSPHSLLLGVFVELGLVGLLILVAMLGLLAVAAWRARRRPLQGMMLAGVVATFAAFPFDHYLLRNFGVSWMWWFFVFGALALTAEAGQVQADETPTR